MLLLFRRARRGGCLKIILHPAAESQTGLLWLDRVRTFGVRLFLRPVFIPPLIRYSNAGPSRVPNVNANRKIRSRKPFLRDLSWQTEFPTANPLPSILRTLLHTAIFLAQKAPPLENEVFLIFWHLKNSSRLMGGYATEISCFVAPGIGFLRKMGWLKSPSSKGGALENFPLGKGGVHWKVNVFFEPCLSRLHCSVRPANLPLGNSCGEWDAGQASEPNGQIESKNRASKQKARGTMWWPAFLLKIDTICILFVFSFFPFFGQLFALKKWNNIQIFIIFIHYSIFIKLVPVF